MSNKQSQVLAFLRKVDSANKSEIYENVDFGYYLNWQKHLGELLSRMVKRGLIERVEKGVYRIKDKPKSKFDLTKKDPNQTHLF